MNIEKSILSGLGISNSDVDRFLPELNTVLADNGIDSFLRVAHFLAQVIHESGHMSRVEENLNYSADRLHAVFPRRFTSVVEAQPYHRNPEKIGNKIYGGRMGNGPASSGDGYKYRGRGLIQLTGKNNYEAFAQWAGEPSIVSDPDQVSGRFAVASAVFFWVDRGLNPLADADNVKAVTKRINGGYNGLRDRIRLLQKAKALLQASPQAPSAPVPVPAASLEAATHRVTATALNFRSSPEVPRSKFKNRIGTLGLGKDVVKVMDADNSPWVQIRVLFKGMLREGYVSGEFLEPIPGAASAAPQAPAAAPALPPAPPASIIKPSHLSENRSNITRARDGGRAFPLGESDRPGRSANTPQEKAQQLISIVNYLDSANTSHKRYQPKSGTTYCNIYAFDYCYLAGVFMPRTWWTDSALRRLRNNEDVPAVYGNSVTREMNANMLHNWFEDYGADFGWHNEVDLDSLQESANEGEVCIIVAQRKDPGRSGHIVAVVPEHGSFNAKRNRAGEVLQPVESQAGSRNFRFKVGSNHWWQHDRFRSFGYWRNP